MTDPARKRPMMRVLLSIFLATAMLAVLVPRSQVDPDRALQNAVASALAADDRLLEVALEQYREQAPAMTITYGHLDLFREQLARFGPQVIPIVAAYQTSFTTADVLQVAGQALQSVTRQLPGGGLDLAPLTPEERGLIALLKMQDEGNAFVGQWEITAAGEAKRIPSRVVTLAGPELLIGGLTALERGIVQEREIDWQTYGLAAVDLAAIASGVALLRFARTAARGIHATPVATGTVTLRSGALATARVLGINAVRFGVPIGLVALMVWHPDVFTHYLWILAENLGMPGILGPIIGWGIVVVPLAFLFSWMLLSVRLLRFAGWICAGAARGCRHLAMRLAATDDR
ncbi:MAG: hypothetical protein ACREJ5_17690 [Geminicoccaceae bacterium]